MIGRRRLKVRTTRTTRSLWRSRRGLNLKLYLICLFSVQPLSIPPRSLLTKVINKADRVSREVFNPYKYDRAFVFVGSEAGAEEENKGGSREL